ncbi:MAG: SH3 domain-containing protein [Pseudomonadota bacterium]|nr:SH3 domain-containing protein [Pseudomonadota bacterium]
MAKADREAEKTIVEPRPVRVGHDGPDLDACAAYGEVRGLNPDGDNFLAVRNAPSPKAAEIDRINEGTGVAICDEADGWLGIVYEDAESAPDCGTGSPVAKEQDYDGPCKSGWVSKTYIELLAG